MIFKYILITMFALGVSNAIAAPRFDFEQVETIVRAGDGKTFIVTCKDGSIESGVTEERILAEDICKSDPSDIWVGLHEYCVTGGSWQVSVDVMSPFSGKYVKATKLREITPRVNLRLNISKKFVVDEDTNLPRVEYAGFLDARIAPDSRVLHPYFDSARGPISREIIVPDVDFGFKFMEPAAYYFQFQINPQVLYARRYISPSSELYLTAATPQEALSLGTLKLGDGQSWELPDGGSAWVSPVYSSKDKWTITEGPCK